MEIFFLFCFVFITGVISGNVYLYLYKILKIKNLKRFMEYILKKSFYAKLLFFSSCSILFIKSINCTSSLEKFKNFNEHRKKLIKKMIELLILKATDSDILKFGLILILISSFIRRNFSVKTMFVFIFIIVCKSFGEVVKNKYYMAKPGFIALSRMEKFWSVFFIICILHTEKIISNINGGLKKQKLTNLIAEIELKYITFTFEQIFIEQLFFILKFQFFQHSWALWEENIWQYSNCRCILNFIYIMTTFNKHKTRQNIKSWLFIFWIFIEHQKQFDLFAENFTYNEELKHDIEMSLVNPTQVEINLQKSQECIVCRNRLTPELSKILRCNHILHDSCIHFWVKTDGSCPNCHTSIVFPKILNGKRGTETAKTIIKKESFNLVALSTGGFRKNLFEVNLKEKKFYFSALPSLFPKISNFLFFHLQESKVYQK